MEDCFKRQGYQMKIEISIETQHTCPKDPVTHKEAN